MDKAPLEPLTCDITTCQLDSSACALDSDEWGNFKKREIDIGISTGNASYTGLGDGDWEVLDRRGPQRPFNWFTTGLFLIRSKSLTYPTPAQYMANLQRGIAMINRWWEMRSRWCNDPSVGPTAFTSNAPPTGGQVEHIIPLSFLLGRFPAIANHGRHFESLPVSARRNIPTGQSTRRPGIPDAFWQNVWTNANGLPSTFPRRQPDQYINEQIGSNTNPTPFVFLRDAINGAKGRLEIFNRPMSDTVFDGHVAQAVAGNDEAIEAFLAPLREASKYPSARQFGACPILRCSTADCH